MIGGRNRSERGSIFTLHVSGRSMPRPFWATVALGHCHHRVDRHHCRRERPMIAAIRSLVFGPTPDPDGRADCAWVLWFTGGRTTPIRSPGTSGNSDGFAYVICPPTPWARAGRKGAADDPLGASM